MLRMQHHAERFDTEVIFDHISEARLDERPLRLTGDYATYTCEALIITTGASAKYLGLDSEEAYRVVVSPPARPVMASFIVASKWPSSAGATRRWRKPSTYRTLRRWSR